MIVRLSATTLLAHLRCRSTRIPRCVICEEQPFSSGTAAFTGLSVCRSPPAGAGPLPSAQPPPRPGCAILWACVSPGCSLPSRAADLLAGAAAPRMRGAFCLGEAGQAGAEPDLTSPREEP